MAEHYDVVIAGGAGIGSAVAYFLAAEPSFTGSIQAHQSSQSRIVTSIATISADPQALRYRRSMPAPDKYRSALTPVKRETPAKPTIRASAGGAPTASPPAP